jgi:hypothetical protein
MREQAQHAKAVWAGQTVLDPELFYPLPPSNAEAATEADGSLSATKDVTTAFAAGLYALTYGPASTKLHLQEGDMVKRSVQKWSNTVSDMYSSRVRPAAYRRLFFEGGLWRVFIDRFDDSDQSLRKQMWQAAGNTVKNQQLREFAEATRPYFARTPPARSPSHIGSHLDAVRFANTTLHIAEKELAAYSPDDKARILETSLPELRRLAARLEMAGVNLATSDFLLDKKSLYKKEYLSIDDRRQHIGFNMEAIQNRIQASIPDVTNYNHRGCSVVYQTTRYNGQETPIFSVMEATILRIYRTTGALSITSLRTL